ncbi:histone H4 [Babesia ovis]|uniref:Histone H4 n=1 Tax=Babesia ovis TaxID=5869 RepID=A0A9W5T9J8_BABOV|nr:histone H4 [Babesia ovis]
MFSFLRVSAVRLSDGALSRRVFRTADDCFGLLSTGSVVETQDLYDAFKFLATNNGERLTAVTDSRLGDMLTQVETRLPSLNSSYMGNFALRIATIAQTAGNTNPANSDLCRSVLSKIATTMVNKGGRLRELAQVAYATAAVGVDSDAIFELSKQRLTADIDTATPDALNMALQAAYKRNSRDRIYYALLCEKLCELTDRFTAHDVMSTLRTLSKTGLLKGFLLRRLSTLIMDNLDQFTPEQLSEASYRLSQMKFMTPANYSRLYAVVEPHLSNIPERLRVQLLAAGCLCESDKKNELEMLLDNLEHNGRWDLPGCVDYIFSSSYLRRYNDQLPRFIEGISKYTPNITRKYALLLKESLDSIVVESAPVEYDLVPRWRETLDNYDKTTVEINKTTPVFQEVRKILQGVSSNFSEYHKVGPFSVPFVDEERKLAILIEFGTNMSNLVITKRCLEALGHQVGMVKYWEWRRLKTERQELEYAFRLFDTRRKGSLTFNELKRLLCAVGINLSRRELSYLQMEEDIRGSFILEDVLALGASFYSDDVIRERLTRAFEAHFPGQKSVSRDDLEPLLYKLGRQLNVDPSEIEACLNLHCGGESVREISVSSFINIHGAVSPGSTRPPTLVVCNWKCYTPPTMASEMIPRFGARSKLPNLEVLTAPCPVYLRDMVSTYASLGSGCIVCSQDVSAAPLPYGRYTGDVTAGLLKDMGVNWTIVGHSERRDGGPLGIDESRRLINLKLKAALAAGLRVIVCIGENAKRDINFVIQQLEDIFADVTEDDDRIVVAYEPVTSVGTDCPVDPKEVNAIIDRIKTNAKCNLRRSRFIYGGSVDEKNAIHYISQPKIDGIMIGRLWQRPDFNTILETLSESLSS